LAANTRIETYEQIQRQQVNASQDNTSLQHLVTQLQADATQKAVEIAQMKAQLSRSEELLASAKEENQRIMASVASSEHKTSEVQKLTELLEEAKVCP